MKLIDTAASAELGSSELVARYAAALAAVDAVSMDVAQYRALPESALLCINSMAAARRRLDDSHLALIAGEIAHRSAPELGSQGLAQRSGHRTAEHFVKVTNQSTGRSAVTAVRIGVLLHEAATAGEVDEFTGVVAVPMPAVARSRHAGTREPHAFGRVGGCHSSRTGKPQLCDHRGAAPQRGYSTV
ncbi:MAG TPA: hypothetical protein VIJ11_08365 [Galbitalea sp.]